MCAAGGSTHERDPSPRARPHHCRVMWRSELVPRNVGNQVVARKKVKHFGGLGVDVSLLYVVLRFHFDFFGSDLDFAFVALAFVRVFRAASCFAASRALAAHNFMAARPVNASDGA